MLRACMSSYNNGTSIARSTTLWSKATLCNLSRPSRSLFIPASRRTVASLIPHPQNRQCAALLPPIQLKSGNSGSNLCNQFNLSSRLNPSTKNTYGNISPISSSIQIHNQQRRGYIFFPSSFSEMTKSLKEAIQSAKLKHKDRSKRRVQRRKKIMIRLRTTRQQVIAKMQIQRQQRMKRYQSMKLASKNRYLKTKSRFHKWKRTKHQQMFRQLRIDDGGNFTGISGRNSPVIKRLNKLLLGKTKYFRGKPGLGEYPNPVLYLRQAITITEPFQNDWFTKDGYPLTSRDPRTDRFVNPWSSESTNGQKTWQDFWRWRKERLSNSMFTPSSVQNKSSSPSGHEKEGLVSENVANCQDKNSIITPPSSVSKVKATWIGHATTFVQISNNNGFTLLTDPIFSEKASPLQFLGGVSRIKPPSVIVEQLPPVDVCLISHDHYDHLDKDSHAELIERDIVKFWVVPLGIKEWLVDVGVPGERIVELEWWEKVKFVKNIKEEEEEEGGDTIRIVTVNKRKIGERHYDAQYMKGGISSNCSEMELTCAPAQHWCSRSPFDRNKRLWCSWALHSTIASLDTEGSNEKEKLSYYFAGDTGYPESFPLHRQIGDRLGPFDLAAIPIGAYKPRFFMKDSHCNPSEAVKIHQDVQAKRSFAIHWGTFPLAEEPDDEPPILLEEEISRLESESESDLKGNNSSFNGLVNSSRIDFQTIPYGASIESADKLGST